MMHRLMRRLRGCCLLLLVLLYGCGITVTGEVFDAGPATVVSTASLSRNEGNAAAAIRLVERSGTDPQTFLDRQRTLIRIQRRSDPGDLDETYHYLVFGTPRALYEGGTATTRSVVLDRIGRLTHVSATQGTPSLTSIDAGGLHVGNAWLAVVQGDDRIVPWLVRPNEERCFPTGTPGDCFDVQSLTRLFFEAIADSVEEGVAEVPGVRVVRSLLHAVPRVVHAGIEASREFPRARGFGFIYEVQLVHTIGIIQVFVPINLIFADEATLGYRLIIDPVALGRQQVSETLPGVLIKGQAFTSLVESQIRERVLEAVGNQTLPVVNSVPAERFILSGINATAGNPLLSPGLFAQYEAILIPDSVDPTSRPSTILDRTPGGPIVDRRPMKIVFLE